MTLKKALAIIFFSFLGQTIVMADTTHYLDFKFILNESEAGKKAQTELKNKLENGFKNIKNKESKLQEEEKKIIEQKKIISPEDYKNKVSELRKKVSSLQKQRNNLLQSVAKSRSKARTQLLNNLNPILKDYMKEKNIKIIVDKKNILLADESLDITKDIISLLNKKIKSLKIN